MVTIKDIARALDVSPSTVTRALAGSARISADTVRRVRQCADAMGYVADSSARAMQSGKSALVGLLMPDIQNNFYATMARTAVEYCRRKGFQLVLSVTEDDPQVEEEHIRALVGARCAGTLIVPTGKINETSCGLLSSVPTVQMVRRSNALQASGFGINDRKALESACGYLLDLGHREIGLLVGDESLNTARERRAGFIDAFHAREIEPNVNLILQGSPRAQHGHDATSKLLSAPAMPTAIVGAGAALTEGMLDATSEQFGTSPPAVSLLGFGDNPAFRWWRGGGLTTVSLPLGEIVSAACERLFELISRAAGGEGEDSFTAFETGLIMRSSTHPAGPESRRG